MAKPVRPSRDRDSSPRTAGSTTGQPIAEDEAARIAQVLGPLLSACRTACDDDLAEEQPVGTFRVEEI